MIQRKQLVFNLDNRWEITVWEANWDMSSIPDRIRKEAQELRASQNGSANLDLLSFHEFIYPWLFAYSTGNVPTLEEAFNLSDEELDKWYVAVRYTNPELFPEVIAQSTIVTFRDNSTFTIQSSRLPSSIRRLAHLDNIAHTQLLEHPEDPLTFARRKVYGKLACCSVGAVPSYEEATNDWPASELQTWYEAVLRLNPHLFLTEEEELKLALEEQDEEQAKKNSTPSA